MAGVVFQAIKKKIDKDGKEHYLLSFKFPCNSFGEAQKLKERIETEEWN